MTWLQRSDCAANDEPQAMEPSSSLPRRWVIVVPLMAIRAYQQFFSPLLGAHCRFAPSCSEYARSALLRHGLWRGSFLALQRLLRCHPWHPGGWDPVP